MEQACLLADHDDERGRPAQKVTIASPRVVANRTEVLQPPAQPAMLRMYPDD
jgi:hypothetical protein